jgi:hypothetical protein
MLFFNIVPLIMEFAYISLRILIVFLSSVCIDCIMPYDLFWVAMDDEDDEFYEMEESWA